MDRSSSAQFLTFGPFRLCPAERVLFEDGKALRLGSRALEILLALVERAGEVVSKDELVKRVWPDTFVEEANLRVHIGALRKVLGEGREGARYIENIPGRGYCLVAPVRLVQEHRAGTPPATDAGMSNLPAPRTRLIGRSEVVRILAERIPKHRLVTIVGPGGIGKTTVALAVAEGVNTAYQDGTRFLDLAAISDAKHLDGALAMVLGVSILSGSALPALVAHLRDKNMLLVLDNCEHLIEAAAALVEGALDGAPDLCILATSREPLRATGEWVHKLSSLESPPKEPPPTAEVALQYPAVQLFAERALETTDDFTVSDANAPLVAEICRRLDGLPLPIELAAGVVQVFGIHELFRLLDQRLSLLTSGRRTARPRHQTLRAMLDWSYEILTAGEQAVLRRLSVFAGQFTLDTAVAVLMRHGLQGSDVLEALTGLATKSLLATDVSGDQVRFRLLETTRMYALEKLGISGERAALARSHAEVHRDVLNRSAHESRTLPTSIWLATYGAYIDDLRVALEWAYAPEGDIELGVSLTVAALPLWFQLSLERECSDRVSQALAKLGSEANEPTRRSMMLYAAQGAALLYAGGAVPELNAAWSRVLEIAESLGDKDFRFQAFWGLWVYRLRRGEIKQALQLARDVQTLATEGGEPAAALLSDRMLGIALHFRGEEDLARMHLERVIANYVTPVDRLHLRRFHVDHRLMSRFPLGHILWVQGLVDQSLRLMLANLEEARSATSVSLLSYVLGDYACYIALCVGDLQIAERMEKLLLDHSVRCGFEAGVTWSGLFRSVRLIKSGDLSTGIKLLRVGLRDLTENAHPLCYEGLVGELASALGRVGEAAEGLRLIDDAINRCTQKEQLLCLPEFLRIKGDLVLQAYDPDAPMFAETCFNQALGEARARGALSTELRIAMSLAGLWYGQRRTTPALELLKSVRNRFTEGFESADVRRASDLIDRFEAGEQPNEVIDVVRAEECAPRRQKSLDSGP